MREAGSLSTCLLPGGLVGDDGVVHREAEFVPLSGREEELLADRRGESPAARVTAVLARCVRRIGAVEVTPAVARRLLVADRQFLLMKLREATFGDRVAGTLSCPWPQCGARMDLDFSTRDIPVRSAEEVAATYHVELTEAEAPRDASGRRHEGLTFRLPNGEDQEVLGPLLPEHPARALTGLLERCLLGTDAGWDEVPDLVAALSPHARQAVEQAMETHAPRLDLEMDLACPECGRASTVPFDVQDFFFGELQTSRDLLYRQVHYLAYHYHWSEREILDMSRDKRLAYIEVLADEIEALNDAY
jgi:hypothetical protein